MPRHPHAPGGSVWRRGERQAGRILIRLLLLFAVPIALIVGALYWYALSERYVTTDNAYVKSDLIAVSPAIDGRVVAVHVVDNQRVARGDVLFELDRRPHEAELARANARLDAIRNDIAAMQAQYAQIQAEIADAEARVRYLERRRKREQDLAARGMSTESKIDDVQYDVSEAMQRLRALEQRAREVLAGLGGAPDLDPVTHPKYREALAARDAVALDLEYTRVVAPRSGAVSRMRLQEGEWVESGDAVFSIIADDAVWLEANLKETQLTHVEVGQAVTFVVDAYPDVNWRGRVASLSAATGSEFLVLPAQNATGNWVKVVQRLPVRIEIEGAREGPALRAGMTVAVSIDTQREGNLLALVRGAAASLSQN